MKILQEAESGQISQAELCRKHGISANTFDVWKRKHAGMENDDIKSLTNWVTASMLATTETAISESATPSCSEGRYRIGPREWSVKATTSPNSSPAMMMRAERQSHPQIRAGERNGRFRTRLGTTSLG